jgi:FkbM family methyltransferase
MNLKNYIRTLLAKIFTLFNKAYLFEYLQLKRNEAPILAPIAMFYKGFITPNFKIIDVGANLGNYSQVFINYGANVIAVEPQEQCQHILNKRFNNVANFKLIPSATGAAKSVAVINKSASHTIASMSTQWIQNVKNSNRFNGENWSETETVNVTTLDTIILENFMPNYIKIDVEGYELEVLNGLSKAVDYISFEITLPEMTQLAIDCVTKTNTLGTYTYALPNAPTLLETNVWYNYSQIVAKLQQLGSSKEVVSADVFCKKN